MFGKPMRCSLSNMSTPGLFFATLYVGLFVLAYSYTVLFAASIGELLYLGVLLLPWTLVAAPLFSYVEGSDVALHVVFAVVNTILIYGFGKKLGRYFAA